MRQETTSHGLLSAVNLVLKWLYFGIEWPKDTKSDAFVQGSYCIGLYLSGRRRKFGFNVHITVPDSFCAGAKTIRDRASVHT